MIEVLTQPGDIELSNNQIVCKFRATDAFGAPYGPIGATAGAGVDVNGFPASSTLTLTWTDPDGIESSVTFTANVSPSLDTHIQAAVGPQTFDYFVAVAAKIQSHPFISPFFTIEAENDDPIYLINATAIDTDDSYVLDWSATGVTLGSDTSDPAVADNTPSNYELILELFIDDAYEGNSRFLSQSAGKPDSAAIIAFDIAEMLHKGTLEGRTYPPIPAYGNTDPLLAEITRDYYIRYRETYDGSTEGYNYLNTKKLLYGGIKKNLFADYDFFASLTATNSLLTWYPDKKDVSLDQPEYIAWYNYLETDETVVLEVKYYQEDGTVGTVNKHAANTIVVKPKDVLLIPVGYTQLGLGALSLDIKKYTVRVKSKTTTDYYSQVRTYYVDDNYYHDKRYIMYLNGFGVPQTLRCIGQLDTDLEVTRQSSERILPIAYRSLDSETVQTDVTYITPYTFRTGYLTKWEVESLQELLIYNDAYLITERGFTPLDITDKKFDFGSSRQSLHSLAFKATPRFIDKNYSNINFPLEAAQAGWGTAPGIYWWDDNSQIWST